MLTVEVVKRMSKDARLARYMMRSWDVCIQTKRKGCSADDRYKFQCPHFGLQQRFGDHDRLPHPTDCKLYYACLRNGLPRQASCQRPLVFNPETGFCDDQNNVPGCAGFYTEEETFESFDKEALASKIR